MIRHTFFALGGPCELQIAADHDESARQIAHALEGEARAIERRYSRYLPDSIVSRINSAAGGDAIDVDEEMAALLNFAATAHAQSGGLFDITSGVLRRAWDFKLAKLPDQQLIDSLLPLIGWQRVEWRAPLVRLPTVGMQIDLGGLGKEFAVDRLLSLAISHGAKHVMVNLAGDVAVYGGKPDGSAWSIGIAHPREERSTIASLQLYSGAVATSGDYQRYIEVAGRRYCHILNPRSGWPAQGVRSVSVVARSCLIAGTVTTTAMLKGEHDWNAYLVGTGLKALVVDQSGQLTSIEGSAATR